MTMYQAMSIEFRASGRGKAQCPPDGLWPEGKALDISDGRTACNVKLPYPAPECGAWLVRCMACGASVGVTAAGRPDDPVSIRLACSNRGTAQ